MSGPNADCTVDTCPLEDSYWDYRPSLALNGIMIGIFGLSMLIHAVQGARYKTWGFLVSMVVGCFGEFLIIGRRARGILGTNMVWCGCSGDHRLWRTAVGV